MLHGDSSLYGDAARLAVQVLKCGGHEPTKIYLGSKQIMRLWGEFQARRNYFPTMKFDLEHFNDDLKAGRLHWELPTGRVQIVPVDMADYFAAGQ